MKRRNRGPSKSPAITARDAKERQARMKEIDEDDPKPLPRVVPSLPRVKWLERPDIE